MEKITKNLDGFKEFLSLTGKGVLVPSLQEGALSEEAVSAWDQFINITVPYENITTKWKPGEKRALFVAYARQRNAITDDGFKEQHAAELKEYFGDSFEAFKKEFEEFA